MNTTLDSQNITVAVVDDFDLPRESLVSLLSGHLNFDFQEFSSADDLYELIVGGNLFNLYLITWKLDPSDVLAWGDELAEKILELQPTAKIIIISSDDRAAGYAEKLGVIFLGRNSSLPDILETIKELLKSQ